MVQVAVNQDKVINLLDDVYKKATSLEVQKEQSQKLKNEMTNNYDDYRNAIIRAYTNAQERS
jgi:serine/threonine-protein kinase